MISKMSKKVFFLRERAIGGLIIIFFILVLYFLTPYVLPFFGIKSYIIITNSMEHKEGSQPYFEKFWQDLGTSAQNVPYKNGLKIGDLVIFWPAKGYSVGDIVYYKLANEYRVHRIYELNQTHFKDIADGCFDEKRSETVLLVLKGYTYLKIDDPDSVEGADEIFQAPAYYTCSHGWLPLIDIVGKAVVVLPRAGMLHLKLYPFDINEYNANDFNEEVMI